MTPPLLVLLATAPGNTRRPEGLASLGAHTLILNTSPGWAVAANALLDEAAAVGGDALFLDDDITWTSDATRALLSHRGAADMLGFDLWLPVVASEQRTFERIKRPAWPLGARPR